MKKKPKNKNMPKLGHYLLNKKSKNDFFCKKTPKNQLFRGAGGWKTQNNQKYAKTRSLPTFWAKNLKMNFFVEKPKNQLFRGLGVENPPKKQKYAKRRSLPTVWEQIQKWNFFVENLKIYFLGGLKFLKSWKFPFAFFNVLNSL